MNYSIHTADLQHALLPLAKFAAFLTETEKSDIAIKMFVQRMTTAPGGTRFREVWDKVVADVAQHQKVVKKVVALADVFPVGTRLIDTPNPEQYQTGK